MPTWKANFTEPLSGNLTLQNGAANIHIPSGGKQGWEVKFISTIPLKLVKGKTYTVEIEAYSEKNRTSRVELATNQEPYTGYGGGTVIITTKKSRQSFSFSMEKESSSNPFLVFYLGGIDGDVTFNNIWVYEK